MRGLSRELDVLWGGAEVLHPGSVLRKVGLGLVIGLLASPLRALAQGDPQPTPSPSVTVSVSPSPHGCALPPQPTPTEVTPSPRPTVCPTPSPLPGDDLGPRPYGLSGLKSMFGRRCNSRANDARTFFPNTWGRGTDGYVYYHSKLFDKVTGDVLAPLLEAGADQAFDYGIWGYSCRIKTGGSSWSVHSWGAAIDTNTLRNPFGQTYWIGKGADRRNYRRTIPDAYMNEDFYWGINFNDPMHFQYVDGY